ncbi:hypothetical protein TRICI_002169 [Trichomonascus ciferrii]|uniref:Transcription factor 25 n=1 Tax=Trichomonascus ciferrii TaxID=44093 RepID=A0A642V7B2_9ASCO|nr:hypothetical protein TRICI_002169 [Trichomonascus ciferrii]
MSSRAVKKLYGQESDLLGNDRVKEEDDSSEEEEDVGPAKPNLFALLNAGGDDNDDEEEESEKEEPVEAAKPAVETTTSKSKKKKKKKNKKKKKKGGNDGEEEEDIDKILEESMKKASLDGSKEPQYFKFLQVDTRHLDYEREFRQLFGNDAIERDVDGGNSIFPPATSQPPKDWGGRDGRSIPGTSRKLVLTKIKPHFYPVLRRDILMEEIRGEVDEPGTTEFKFVHSEQYKACQNTFNLLTMMSSDPQTILNHVLPKSFYHVPTLLIIAENLVQTGQHSEAADMLERCLLVYDRALRSNFSFQSGKCRLPFKYFENRGFYLVVFKYIKTLMRRGTWLTAFEFDKLLWSLSPNQDPYGAGYMIDFFAMNAAEYEYIIDLGDDPHFQSVRSARPNLFYSRALAYHKKNPMDHKTTKQLLRTAVSKFPWVASDLLRGYFQHDYEVFPEQAILSGLYVVQMTTFWDNDSQLIKLLKQVCDDPSLKLDPVPQPLEDDVSVDIVRYALLSEQKEVFSLIPKHYLEGEMWADDLIPPQDDISPYPQRGSISRDDIVTD